MDIQEHCLRANMLPTWRKLHLSHMRQIRMMIRNGRQVVDALYCLKNAQRSALAARKQWFAAKSGEYVSRYYLMDLAA